VIFNTGESIDCDANHLWVTMNDKEREQALRLTPEFRQRRRKNRASRALENPKKKSSQINITNLNQEREYIYKEPPLGKERTTKEILKTLKIKHGKIERPNHSVDVCGALDLPRQDLLISPYLLGLWLGDGCKSTGLMGMLESDLRECLKHAPEEIEYERLLKGYKQPYLRVKIKYFKDYLKLLGILGKKRIPTQYLRASIEQRKELLQGIMDTDGSCDKRGQCELGLSDRDLIEDVHELISSLGIIATIRTKELSKKNPKYKDSHRLKFVADFPVFKIKRKLNRQKMTDLRATTKRRYIVDVKPIPTVPMRCITVACPTGTYLTGRSFIPTHNSHAMRVIALAYALEIPNIQIYLFRRLSEDLKKNHLDGPSGFANLLSPFVNSGGVKINYSSNQIVFSNGSKIHLCHCQHEKDKNKYQGVEINVLLIDELTHFTEDIYKFLRSRVRLGSLDVPEKYKSKLPKIIASSNPGGIGHDFVKHTFIDNKDPMKVYQVPDEEGGMLRQFIPAKLIDNPTMQENDPLYSAKLLGLGGAMAKAMLEGDWDAIEGAYFDRWDKDKHVIDSFIIPAGWFKVRAFDWGYSAPFCTLWGAISDGSIININGKPIVYPRDSIIIYREYYGTTGKPNQGIKLTAGEVAKNTRQMQIGEEMGIQVADPAIFDVSSGISLAEQMAKEGVLYHPADNKRIAGWQQIRDRLMGVDGKPLLYIMNTCKNLIRTLPIMQYDNTRPEDLDTKMEDHAVDTLRYLCMSRPITIDLPKGPLEIADQWHKDFNPKNVRAQIKRKNNKKSFE